MPTALVSRQFLDAFGHQVAAVAKRNGRTVEFVTPPEAPGARLSSADCHRIDCTFCDRDMRFDEQTNAVFEDAMMKSKSMKWLHVASSGLYPVAWVDVLAAKGATITSSTGSNAEPVAQTGFTGAHLDAHSEDPLPPESPLWDMPNVIVTPHNAAASTGNEKGSAEMFIANFGHWIRGEPMFNLQQVL